MNNHIRSLTTYDDDDDDDDRETHHQISGRFDLTHKHQHTHIFATSITLIQT